jgi:hypothetical protein
MATSFDDLIESMGKAPMKRKGTYMEEGLFTVEIINTLRKQGWNKTFTARDKDLFIAEFRILESTNPAHPVGSTASWACKDPVTGNAGDVKAFMLAVAGVDPRTVKDTDAKAQKQAALLAYAAMGEAEALKALELEDGFVQGKRVKLETRKVKTKAGGDFTVHAWSPVEDTE